MKNKIGILIIVLLLGLLCSCNISTNSTNCKVTFNYDNGTNDVEMVVGKGTYLIRPEAPTKEGYIFMGWFDEDVEWIFSVNKVEKDVTLKAVWEIDTSYNNGDNPGVDPDPNVNDDKLEDVLKKLPYNNCKIIEEELLEGELSFRNTYCIQDNLIKYLDEYTYDGESYSDLYYLELNNGEFAYLIYEYNDEYYKVPGEDVLDYLEYTDFYYDYYDFSALKSLKANDFSINGNVYTYKGSNVNTIGKDVIGDYDDDLSEDKVTEVFKSLVIEISDGYISKLTFVSDYSVNANKKTCEYRFTFSEFDAQEIVVPDAIDDNGFDIYDSLASVYKKADGEEVTVGGYIKAFLGQNVFICDDERGLLVYFKNTSYVPNNLAVGAYLVATGKKTTFSGLVELAVESADNVSVDDSEIEDLNSITISDFSNITNDNINDVVNLEKIKIKTLGNISTSADSSIVLIDGSANEITLYIKKYNEQYTLASSLFKDLDLTKTYTLENVAISYHKTSGLQLSLTAQTQLVDVKGLSLSYNSKTVNKGVTIDDALSDLKVIYYGDTVKELKATEYLIDSQNYDANTAGMYTVLIKYLDESAAVNVKVIRGSGEIVNNAQGKTVQEVADTLEYCNVGLPSTGDVNILVIPVAFPNKNYPTNYKETLEKGFNGTSEDTGWESLKSYYNKVSFGKLNITATILDAYVSSERPTYTNKDNEYLDYDCLKAALKYYDKDVDYANYDNNDDGYIDCVYLIYLAPYDGNTDLWWAYTNEFIEEDDEIKLDNKGIDWYMWMSFDFFSDPIAQYQDETYNINVSVNAETVIHETGHALGLDDLYDYKSGNGGGVGGCVMMDYNQGDHDPYSKSIMGWINPTVIISKNYTVDLTSYTNTGSALFIAKEYDDTFFNEFYIVIFYTPDGVNAIKKDADYGIIEKAGVMVYHLDATLIDDINKAESIIDITKYNNGNNSHKLLSVINSKGKDPFTSNEDYADGSVLFSSGSSLKPKWYDGSTCPFTINVGTVSESAASINISFN